jgi:STE24 endopeptidase
MFYVNLIVPLFNKLSPLPEGKLKQKILDFAQKVNFKIKNIRQIDASKRSKKANAYFSGLGTKKNIILFDSLFQQLADDEIVAVLAHETGHFKKKHTTILFFISIFITAAELYIFSLFIGNQNLASALGAQSPSFHIVLTGFFFIFEPVSTVLSVLINILSRKFEFQADRFAAENYDAELLISALKKLHVKSLSNIIPHKAYVFIHYSHPPLYERIEKLKNLKSIFN